MLQYVSKCGEIVLSRIKSCTQLFVPSVNPPQLSPRLRGDHPVTPPMLLLMASLVLGGVDPPLLYTVMPLLGLPPVNPPRPETTLQGGLPPPTPQHHIYIYREREKIYIYILHHVYMHIILYIYIYIHILYYI